jgi:hypothetical protein
LIVIFFAVALTTAAIVIIASAAAVDVAVVVGRCHRCHIRLSFVVVVFGRLCRRRRRRYFRCSF